MFSFQKPFVFLSLLYGCCLFPLIFYAAAPSSGSDLMQDLMIVDYWNKVINDRLPVTYNHLLQGGYLNMPSARMGADGEIGAGYAWVNPYINYNLRAQLTKFLEVSGNYRIFKGVDDPILTPLGFGDLSDKGANLKISLFSPEDSCYALPGLSFGFEDFIGTKNFRSRYVVLTKVFLDYDTEISLGYGQHRIRGFFGGINWMPFRRCGGKYFKDLSLCAEYDATPYKNKKIELHPKGRVKKTPFNLGIKWRLWDQIDFSLSFIRGHTVAFSVSSYYNFGNSLGFLPKIDNSLPYSSPINTQAVGLLRPLDVLAQDLVHPFSEQGFDVLDISIAYNDCYKKVLKLQILNNNYRMEADVRERLNHLVCALIPEDIEEVVIVVEGDGFPLHEYRFRMPYVKQYVKGETCAYELNILTPLKEYCLRDTPTYSRLFKKHREWINFELFPKTHAFFGSSKGKFKYALGAHVGINGFLYDQFYYSALLGYTFLTNLHELTGVDRLNPSQIVNVRTDVVKYYKRKGLTVDEAFIQKNWNLGRGYFSKIALGYFEEEYGGIATEVLYYPVNSRWAVGVEGALLRKRDYKGLGFTNKFRKLRGFQPYTVKFTPRQFFLNLYYNWWDTKLNFKVKIGKFLANDYGARFELTRYFPSGLELSVWYTYTNGRDKINGKTYHDKGISFSMPLDIFYTHSQRDRWGYGMSAWLRDVGVIASSGKELYHMISEERE